MLNCIPYMLFIFFLLSTNINIKPHTTIIVSVVFYGCKNWFVPLREYIDLRCLKTKSWGEKRTCLSIYGYTVLCYDLDRFFSFLILYTVGRTPWTGDQTVARPLPIPRTTQTQNKHTDIYALTGIRTHDPSVRTSEDSLCLRPRGHCNRRKTDLRG
jgi:hypothetical protein